MNVTSTEQVITGVQVMQPILATNTQFTSTNNLADFVRVAPPSPRHVGYGLPCAKCGTYYMADLSVCPICNCADRISPTTIRAPAGLANARPGATALEERETLPKEFEPQLFPAPLQINTAA